MPRRFIRCLCLLSAVLLLPTVALSEEEISISGGQQWFSENKAALLALHQLVLEKPAIHWVDPALRLEFVPKYDEFDSETEAIYEEIKSICDDMGIKSVSVARVGSKLQCELLAVTYKIKNRGLSISGGSTLTIEYISSDTLLKNMKPPEYEVKPLDLDGWYVVVYRDVPWDEAAPGDHPMQRPVPRSVGRAAASPGPAVGFSWPTSTSEEHTSSLKLDLA